LFYIVFCCCWFPSHVFPLYKLGFITFNWAIYIRSHKCGYPTFP
jgi:hypothetical protein